VPVSSRSRSSSDPRDAKQTPASEKRPLNIVRRILQRNDRVEIAAGSLTPVDSSSASAISPKRSIAERLASFFTEDLPSNVPVPRTGMRGSAVAARGEVTEGSSGAAAVRAKAEELAALSCESESVYAIQLAAKEAMARLQKAYAEIKNELNSHAQELQRREQELERQKHELSSNVTSASASLQQLQAQLRKDLADEMEQSVQALVAESAKRLQEQSDAATAALRDSFSKGELQKPSQALLVESARELQEQADSLAATVNEKFGAERQRFVLETEKQFEELRASRQAFINDTKEQLGRTVQSTFDALTKTAIEEARAELEASKQRFLSETHNQAMAMSRASLELLADDWKNGAIEQLRAELTAAKQASVQATQNELAKITQGSLQKLELLAQTRLEQTTADLATAHEQFIAEMQSQISAATQGALEPHVKLAVEQGRRRLTQMVDSFLAGTVPQIETELRRVADRHRESGRVTASSTAYLDDWRPPVYVPPPRSYTPDAQGAPTARPAPPQPSRLEFTRAESAPKRHFDIRDFWAGVSWGLRIGLLLGLAALLAVAVYFSMPVVRLRPTPPNSFLEDSTNGTPKQRVRENQLARAYWDIAAREIAPKYGFGKQLPPDPPDNFKVEEDAAPGATPKVDDAARSRYWWKLREVWTQNDSWEQVSGWNVEWIRSVWNYASAKLSALFGANHAAASPASAP
jgi:hypothetical protein